ncbi:uncharacterized protein B0T23DRAFT_306342, partial [Neurospora hispaniola]
TISGKKSTKVPEIPRFFNNTTKNKVTFNVWYHQMENKFYVNTDYYTDNRAKFSNIFNRLGSSAAENILPFLNLTHPNRLIISE